VGELSELIGRDLDGWVAPQGGTLGASP